MRLTPTNDTVLCPAQIYMIPEGYQSGALRLYQAVDFPLRWQQKSVVIPKPMIDSSLVYWQDRWWLFGSTRVRRPAFFLPKKM